MKQANVEVGRRYNARVSGRLVTVEVTAEAAPTSTNRRRWTVRNLTTGRVLFMTAARLRGRASRYGYAELQQGVAS